MSNYVTMSLETHLFFGRIMKEHSLFLLASFPAVETDYISNADWYREQFEMLLEEAVQLANGNVRNGVLNSGEIVTEFTERVERQTRKLTGIPINIQITQAEKRLEAGNAENTNRRLRQQVSNLNQRGLGLVEGLIRLKESIIQNVASCTLYTTNYPLLVEHILREARWYRQTLIDLENGRMPNRSDESVEAFWNQIMMEHALFIRGLLDPTECELIDTADDFANDYRKLCEKAKQRDSRVSEEVSKKTLELTENYRDFKAAGTQGIANCNIRSIIVPLLADHVLREANHYLRLLREN